MARTIHLRLFSETGKVSILSEDAMDVPVYDHGVSDLTLVFDDEGFLAGGQITDRSDEEEDE